MAIRRRWLRFDGREGYFGCRLLARADVLRDVGNELVTKGGANRECKWKRRSGSVCSSGGSKAIYFESPSRPGGGSAAAIGGRALFN